MSPFSTTDGSSSSDGAGAQTEATTQRNLLPSFEAEHDKKSLKSASLVGLSKDGSGPKNVAPLAIAVAKKRPRPNVAIQNLMERREQLAWQQIEDKLFILLEGNEILLKVFRNYTGTQLSWPYLSSMAQIVVARQKEEQAINPLLFMDDHSLERLSILFGTGRFSRMTKLVCLRTILHCLTPEHAQWQLVESVVEATLEFLIVPEQEWEFLDHSEEVLLWELRARSLHQQRLEQRRLEKVASVGNTAAFGIASGAKLVENGLACSVPYLTCTIDFVGQKLKPRMQAEEYPLFMNKTAVLALTYSNAAKRGSEAARNATWKMTSSIRETSSRSISRAYLHLASSSHSLSTRNPSSAQIVVFSPECREVLRSMGHVGWTSIGAIAIVGDAVLETGRAVVGKTSQVTAELVAYKYGTSAGQVVLDIGEATQNAIRIVGHVAFLWGESTAVAQSVAKHNAKTLAGETAENGIETPIQLLPTKQSMNSDKLKSGTKSTTSERTSGFPTSAPAPSKDGLSSPTSVVIEELGEGC